MIWNYASTFFIAGHRSTLLTRLVSALVSRPFCCCTFVSLALLAVILKAVANLCCHLNYWRYAFAMHSRQIQSSPGGVFWPTRWRWNHWSLHSLTSHLIINPNSVCLHIFMQMSFKRHRAKPQSLTIFTSSVIVLLHMWEYSLPLLLVFAQGLVYITQARGVTLFLKISSVKFL